MGRSRQDPEKRFMAKVDQAGPTSTHRPDLGPCWEWTSAKNAQGYGQFQVNPKLLRAHRWSYEHFVGPIPEGLHLDHLCLNTGCVNPTHLEPVTAAENTRRWNATRTQCQHGHPFDDENTYRHNGRRYCRTCRREADRRVTERRVPVAVRTHCGKGHEYTADNTYVETAGGRRCLSCRKAGQRLRRQQKKATR